MHPSVTRAFDEIDAAIFSGDTFIDPDALQKLEAMVARWQLAITSLKARAAELDGVDNDR